MFKEFISGYVEKYGHKFKYNYNEQQEYIYGIIINPNKKTDHINITPIGIKPKTKNDILTLVYYPDNNEFLTKDMILSFEDKKYKVLNCDKIMIGENLFYMYADIKIFEG